MSRKNKNNILFVSSSGGHETQLEQIMNRIELNDKTPFIVRERANSKNNKKNELFLKQFNRKEYPITTIIKNSILSIKYFMRIKPNLIITTGAGVVLPLLIVGKIGRAKIIYIESFAKRDDLTITGKVVYHLKLSDRFYVQWPELQQKYKESIYGGTVY